MRIAKLLTAMALDANSFWPIDLGLLALKSIVIQCRTAKDIYLANDPLGTKFFTIKSGTSLSIDLDGGVLDVTNGVELVKCGDFALVGDSDLTLTCDESTQRITRSAGSFLSAGFEAGMTIITDCLGNTGPFTIAGVSALIIVVTGNLVDGGPTAGRSITQAEWTFNSGVWAYSGGKMEKYDDGVGVLNQNFVTTAGGHYRIGYAVSGYSTNGFTVSLGGTVGLTRVADGTYVDYLLVTGASGGIVFTPTNSNSRFSLDDVSIKRVTFPGNSSPIYVKGSDSSLYLEIIALQ